MTNNQNDPKKKNKPNLEENQLSDQELESIAGGGVVSDLVDGAKKIVNVVSDTANNIVSDLKKL